MCVVTGLKRVSQCGVIINGLKGLVTMAIRDILK